MEKKNEACTNDLVGMNRRVHEIEISNIVFEYVAGAAPWALPSYLKLE